MPSYVTHFFSCLGEEMVTNYKQGTFHLTETAALMMGRHVKRPMTSGYNALAAYSSLPLPKHWLEFRWSSALGGEIEDILSCQAFRVTQVKNHNPS